MRERDQSLSEKTSKPKKLATKSSKSTEKRNSEPSAKRANGSNGISEQAQGPGTPPQLELMGSRNLVKWMYDNTVSFAFTTYQGGKVFFIGVNPSGKLSVFERTFPRCMGMVRHKNEIHMSSLAHIWRFKDVLQAGQNHEGYDRCFVPLESRTTGDIDVHDMVVKDDGELNFVCTLFNCVAKVSDQYSFEPVWKPDFISRLAPEDRCHLNGLTLRDGELGYATAVSETDVVDAWRDRRQDGGIVIDIQKNEVICRGLSMPHSPRYHQGKLSVSYTHLTLPTTPYV